jgi:hypothetical protein
MMFLNYSLKKPWRPIGLRIPHCLDHRLTDGGKVVRLTRRPLLYFPKHYFSASDIVNEELLERNVVAPV